MTSWGIFSCWRLSLRAVVLHCNDGSLSKCIICNQPMTGCLSNEFLSETKLETEAFLSIVPNSPLICINVSLILGLALSNSHLTPFELDFLNQTMITANAVNVQKPPLLKKKWKWINCQAHKKCQIYHIWMHRAFRDHEQCLDGIEERWNYFTILSTVEVSSFWPTCSVIKRAWNSGGGDFTVQRRQCPLVLLAFTFKSLHPLCASAVPYLSGELKHTPSLTQFVTVFNYNCFVHPLVLFVYFNWYILLDNCFNYLLFLTSWVNCLYINHLYLAMEENSGYRGRRTCKWKQIHTRQAGWTKGNLVRIRLTGWQQSEQFKLIQKEYDRWAGQEQATGQNKGTGNKKAGTGLGPEGRWESLRTSGGWMEKAGEVRMWLKGGFEVLTSNYF